MHRGFTLVEVLVALAIVAIALAAGARTSASLAQNAQRQTDVLLAQLCAENTLTRLRLARQMPPVGDTTSTCTQAGRELAVQLVVNTTPNPNFLRVEARVADGTAPILALSTVIGRY
ncbi:MAG: type II secretion system minor pseudopilin GspI [Rhodoferax sp.]